MFLVLSSCCDACFVISSLCYAALQLLTMAETPYDSSDLNSVLKTLSSLASQSNQPQNEPADTFNVPPPNNVHPEKPVAPRQPRPDPPKPTSTPTVDPSKITTWPTALRYVMCTVAQDEEAQLRIRGFIRSQHNHERQWWKSREALVQRHQARGDKKKEMDAVL